MWVVHWGLLLRLPWRSGVCPVRARCGGGAAAWVTGVLAAPGTQGSWWLGQQEIECSRRVWQPVLANTLQYAWLEKPPDREAWQATVHRVARNWTQPKQPHMHRCQNLFACGSSAPVRVEHEGGAAAWVAGTLCSTKCAGTRTASAVGIRALPESSFKPLVAGDQEASLASLLHSSACSGT